MATNIKKDPAVIEHVNNEVGKASVKAAKSETTRVLKVVAGVKADVNAAGYTKDVKSAVLAAINSIVTGVKNTEGVGAA